MYAQMQKLAHDHGFARLYALPCADMGAWRENALNAGVDVSLCYTPQQTYPWARSALLLVNAYTPYPKESRIPAYYIASDRGYHACKALCAELAALCRCEAVELPARALALNNGIGAQGRNGLLRIGDLGSRITLHTLLTDRPPQPFTAEPTPACPPDCALCARACPASAIADTLTQRKCMRFYMDEPPYPDWVLAIQSKHIGCEACMDACPFNAPLGCVEPPENVLAAFDGARLCASDAAAARKLVGRNITRYSKLTMEALNFRARDEQK